MMLHGANIYKYAKELGCESDEILDFSSNINCYQPTENFSIPNATIVKYADTNYTSLKNIIAKEYKIDAKEIALYNGATAAIYALMQRLKAKNIYLYAPLYGEYQKAAIESGKNIYKINRIEDIDAKVAKKSIVVFVNPATPEGSYYELERLFLKWKKRKCTIILDESFLEFEAHKSLRKEIKKYKKLYIIQSFSKFYASAGVRIGAIFSHKKNIKKLTQPLWNISSLDALFLEQRLGDRAFKEKALEIHKRQKEELYNILKNSNLFEKIVESDANFILVHTPNATQLFQHLLAHKILVRKCGSFDYLSDEWLRFAVKESQAQSQLETALKLFPKRTTQ